MLSIGDSNMLPGPLCCVCPFFKTHVRSTCVVTSRFCSKEETIPILDRLSNNYLLEASMSPCRLLHRGGYVAHVAHSVLRLLSKKTVAELVPFWNNLLVSSRVALSSPIRILLVASQEEYAARLSFVSLLHETGRAESAMMWKYVGLTRLNNVMV